MFRESVIEVPEILSYDVDIVYGSYDTVCILKINGKV